MKGLTLELREGCSVRIGTADVSISKVFGKRVKLKIAAPQDVIIQQQQKGGQL